MDAKVTDTISKYLADMHSLVSHGHQAIRRQRENLKDGGHPDALMAVNQFEETLDRHMTMLEQRLTALGGNVSSPVQDAAAAVAGVAAGIYNALRSEEASKSIRDDYTFFSHAAIAYLMLHTTSHSLGDLETGRIAEQGYRDLAGLIMHVDRIMPSLVIHELKQDGLAAKDVSDHCHKLIGEAWNRQATAHGFGAKTGSSMTGTGVTGGTL